MEYRFSESTSRFQSSAVRDILKLTQGNAVISFAGGLPAEQFFPLEAVKEAFSRVFDKGNGCLQYGLTEGYTPLREKLCERMSRKGINATPDHMILTTGSQQAIDLLARIYLDPGDVILVERPTYLAALQVFQARGARVVSVDSDADGMLPEDLESKIREHKPKMAYVIPTFSNPTGKVWTLERRKALLRLCQSHGILILEDDPYGELRFGESVPAPTLFSLDEGPDGGVVVYTSTFSKIVAPALRTGWTIADKEIIRQMARMKQAADLHSSTMDQQALCRLMEHFDLESHIALIRREYGQRLQLMLTLLDSHLRDDAHWNRPQGGMFIWLELAHGLNAAELLKEAVREGAAFVPGDSFYAETPPGNTLRMNFTFADDETMRLGIERLSRAVQTCRSDLVRG